jgi:hypothetical protein
VAELVSADELLMTTRVVLVRIRADGTVVAALVIKQAAIVCVILQGGTDHEQDKQRINRGRRRTHPVGRRICTDGGRSGRQRLVGQHG